MINPVNGQINSNSGISFTQDASKKHKYNKDTLLKNNVATNSRIAFDQLSNALTLYPAKGLTGNKNSNFYEFLTMGTVPYIVGSLTLMSVFNSATKHFSSFAATPAAKYGGKMALGVLFYGVAKELAKPLITTPVKYATGVDVDLPYAKVIYELPDYKDDTDITSIEYHKVFESVEFPRWDLLYKNEAKGEKRNAYYDEVAKKMGLGENLKDSDQEVKPRIKEIVTKTQAAKNIIPYLWSAVGVGIAFQKPWEKMFPLGSMKLYKVREYKQVAETAGKDVKRPTLWGKTAKNIAVAAGDSVKNFINTFLESSKEFYKGGENPTKVGKWAGKGLFWLAALSTVAGITKILTTSIEPSKTDAGDVIEKNRKYIVN